MSTSKFKQAVEFVGNLVANKLVLSVAATLSAAGSTIADATDLTKVVTNVSTVGSGQGVQLPDWSIGSLVILRNSGANALTVYPSGTGVKINGGSDGAGVTVAATEVAFLIRVSATNWIGGVAVAF
jgi:hypothetical protein